MNVTPQWFRHFDIVWRLLFPFFFVVRFAVLLQFSDCLPLNLTSCLLSARHMSNQQPFKHNNQERLYNLITHFAIIVNKLNVRVFTLNGYGNALSSFSCPPIQAHGHDIRRKNYCWHAAQTMHSVSQFQHFHKVLNAFDVHWLSLLSMVSFDIDSALVSA